MMLRSPSAGKDKTDGRAALDDAKVMGFGAAVLLLMTAILAPIWVWDGWQKFWRPYAVFEAAECRVLSKRAVPAAAREKDTLYFPELEFEVLARGARYRGLGLDPWKEGLTRAKADAVLARFEKGATYPCWHDPRDPSRAVLVRTVNSSWLASILIVFPCGLMGAGLAFLSWESYRRSRGQGPGRQGSGTGAGERK